MTVNAVTRSQRSCPPRWGTQPTLGRLSLGPRVATVARMLGKPLMPHQEYIATVALEVDQETGRLAYDDVTVVMGRQSGKTTLILPVTAHRMLGFGTSAQRVLYTAQTADKAREKWRDIYVAALKGSPFAELIADVRLRLNFEQLLCTTGSTFSPVTPTAKSGGTGDTIDVAFIDEAWCHEDAGIEQAMSPAMVTREQAQLWAVSTAKRQPAGQPYNPRFAAYLRSRIAAGRARVEAGVNTGTAFFEWSAPEGSDPADPRTWWGCLPAMGYTQSEAAIRTQLERMDLADFCAEFLGWWPSDAALRWQVIPESVWRGLADRSARPGYPIAFGVDTSPDRGMTALVSAGPCGDQWAVEVVEHRGGTAWVVPRLAELVHRWRPCGVAVASGSAAASLIEPLSAQEFPVKVMSLPDVAKAYGGFYEAVMDRGVLRHAAQPELDTAMSLAWKRRVGAQTTWDWGSPGDISPVVAASAALWCAQTFGPAQREVDYDVLRSVY
jgi:hypothetical protein